MDEFSESGIRPRDWVTAVCRQALRIRAATRGAAVSLHLSGWPEFLASDDTWARAIERIQEVTGEGPGVTAYSTGLVVDATDVGSDRRWPGFSALAAQAGLRSVCALPLAIHGRLVGSMSLFGDGTRLWTAMTRIDAPRLAALAVCAMVVDAVQVEAGEPPGAQDCDEVAVAVGMLSVRLGVTVAEAALRLRGCTFNRAGSLEQVARDVIRGRVTVE